MLKPFLLTLLVSSISVSSSFALPGMKGNAFMEQQMKKMLLSHHNSQNNNPENYQSKFTGIWSGTCSSNQNETSKLQIRDERSGFTLISDKRNEEFPYEATNQESYSNKQMYISIINTITRVNDSTRKLEMTGALSSFGSNDSQNATILQTDIFTVNNNQLNVDTYGEVLKDHKQMLEIKEKCVYQRIG